MASTQVPLTAAPPLCIYVLPLVLFDTACPVALALVGKASGSGAAGQRLPPEHAQHGVKLAQQQHVGGASIRSTCCPYC